MESIVGTRTKRSLDVALTSAFRGGALSAPRTGAWRQRLVNLTLVFSDVVFALFTWGIACIAEILWVPGHLSGEMVLSAVPITLVWVGLRATQGLYPGYGMDEAEELKRQT
jgi:hypothetical protein